MEEPKDILKEYRDLSIYLLNTKIEETRDAIKGHCKNLLERVSQESKYQSGAIADIAAALAKFNAEGYNINPTRKGGRPGSYYADLDDIMNAINPGLSKHGLSVVHIILYEGNSMALSSRLLHASGQWIECRQPLINHSDIQKYGGEITYKTRYALRALLSLAIPHDPDDDDGEENVREIRKKEVTDTSLRRQYPGNDDSPYIGEFQFNEIEGICRPWPEITKKICERLEINGLRYIKAGKEYDWVKKQALLWVKTLTDGAITE